MPKTGLLESVTAENRHRDQTKDKSQRYKEQLDCAPVCRGDTWGIGQIHMLTPPQTAHSFPIRFKKNGKKCIFPVAPKDFVSRSLFLGYVTIWRHFRPFDCLRTSFKFHAIRCVHKRLFVRPSICLLLCSSIASAHLSIHVCPSIHLSICLSVPWYFGTSRNNF